MVDVALRTGRRPGQNQFQEITLHPPDRSPPVTVKVALERRVDPIEMRDGMKYDWFCIFDPEGLAIPFDSSHGPLPQDN
jgi:hypothetical protein